MNKQQLLAFWLCGMSAQAKEFINLGFDDGYRMTGTVFRWDIPAEEALPGWTVKMGDQVLEQVRWNTSYPESGSISIMTPPWPGAEGVNAVRLIAGAVYPAREPAVTASISQVGTIPTDANSLLFFGGFSSVSPSEVRINEVVVPLVFLSGELGDPYLYGVDVRPFAAQEVELSFLNHPVARGSGGFQIDSLRFSSVVVPEPETWALLGVGLAVVGYAVRRKN